MTTLSKYHWRRFGRNLLFFPLFLGALVGIGFLAFSGTLLIQPGVLTAILSMLFTVVIEYSVYKPNGEGGLKRLFQLGNFVERSMLKQWLKQQAKDNKGNSNIFADYDHISKHLKQLKQQRSGKRTLKERYADWLARQEEIARYKKRKEKILILLSLHLHKKEVSNKVDEPLLKQFKTHDLSEIAKQITKKKIILRSTAILSVLAGLSFGLVTLSEVSVGLNVLMQVWHFSLSFSAVAAITLITAIAAGTFFALMMYKTFGDLVVSPRLVKIREKIKAAWAQAKHEKFSRVILRRALLIAGLTLFLGLAVVATVLTACTWWIVAQKGAVLIPTVVAGVKRFMSSTKVFLKSLAYISVPAMGVSQLAFAGLNSAFSVFEMKDIPSVIKEQLKRFYKKFKEENGLQKLNPLRWIINIAEIFGRLVFLVLHSFSYGTTSNRVGGFSAILATALVGSSEFLSDFHMVAEFNDLDGHDHSDHHGHEHPHDHDAHHGHDHDHAHGHDHDHNHADIGGIVIKVVLTAALIYPLAALWHWGASKLNRSPEQRLKLGDAFRWAYSIPPKSTEAPKVIETPKLSQSLKYALLHDELSDEVTRLNYSLINYGKSHEKSLLLRPVKEAIIASKEGDEKISFSSLLKQKGIFKNADKLGDENEFADDTPLINHRISKDSTLKLPHSAKELSRLAQEFGELKLAMRIL